MGRPNLQTQRRQEILDATERCLARQGVAGLTLEAVAQEAGLARALIRHNVGNREEVLAATVEAYLARQQRETDEMIAQLPARNRSATLIDWLFDPHFADAHVAQMFDALVASAPDHPEIAAQTAAWMRDFVDALSQVLAGEHPKADPDHILAVASGVTAIYFNADSLFLAGVTAELAGPNKAAAMILVSSLGEGARTR